MLCPFIKRIHRKFGLFYVLMYVSERLASVDCLINLERYSAFRQGVGERVFTWSKVFINAQFLTLKFVHGPTCMLLQSIQWKTL